jgi:hypothetical protein
VREKYRKKYLGIFMFMIIFKDREREEKKKSTWINFSLEFIFTTLKFRFIFPLGSKYEHEYYVCITAEEVSKYHTS